MELTEKAEEVLETLWIRTQEQGENDVSSDEFEEETLAELVEAGCVVRTGDRLVLTEKGLPEARSVVRRHRLAERLLSDVLGTKDVLMHQKACEFEHMLGQGLDESICVLLGHPKVCPHGNPIPSGRCCHEHRVQIDKVVAPLSELAPGQNGKVAYVYAPEQDRLQKLLSMGVLPGAPIHLVQRFPSYVFQVGQTQFAVDKQIADAIYVRLTRRAESSEVRGEPRRGRRRGWRRGKLLFR